MIMSKIFCGSHRCVIKGGGGGWGEEISYCETKYVHTNSTIESSLMSFVNLFITWIVEGKVGNGRESCQRCGLFSCVMEINEDALATRQGRVIFIKQSRGHRWHCWQSFRTDFSYSICTLVILLYYMYVHTMKCCKFFYPYLIKADFHSPYIENIPTIISRNTIRFGIQTRG